MTDTTISIPPSSNEELEFFDFSTLSPIPMVRQTGNLLRYVRYENGILVDQDGNPTTPEEHQTTHAEILEYIRAQRHRCHIEDDEEFLALIDKYSSNQVDSEKPSKHTSLRLLKRQYTMEGYLTYVDGVLVDYCGIPTTPEEHHTTHAEILINIFQIFQELFCYKHRKDDFLEVLHKYVPESMNLSPEEYYKFAMPSPGGVITHYTDSHGNTHKRSIPIICGSVTNTYQDKYILIGLTATTTIGNLYETSLHNETGKGTPIQREFTAYTIYIAKMPEQRYRSYVGERVITEDSLLSQENAYYAVHLSVSHCALFGKTPCSIGEMQTTPCLFEDVIPQITHIPTLSTTIKFKLKDSYQDVSVHSYNDPGTCVFQFSRHGNDEQTPCGFVYVNMGLFTAL